MYASLYRTLQRMSDSFKVCNIAQEGVDRSSVDGNQDIDVRMIIEQIKPYEREPVYYCSYERNNAFLKNRFKCSFMYYLCTYGCVASMLFI